MCLFLSFVIPKIQSCELHTRVKCWCQTIAAFHKNSKDAIMWVAHRCAKMRVSNSWLWKDQETVWYCGIPGERPPWDHHRNERPPWWEITTLMIDDFFFWIFFVIFPCQWTTDHGRSTPTHPPTHTPCGIIYAWLSLWCHQRFSSHRVYTGELWPFLIVFHRVCMSLYAIVEGSQPDIHNAAFNTYSKSAYVNWWREMNSFGERKQHCELCPANLIISHLCLFL